MVAQLNFSNRSLASRTPSRLLGASLALLMLATVFPAPAAAASDAPPLPPLGMSMESVKPLTDAGAAPRYGSYWVGVWMNEHGWNGLTNALRTAKATGTTPVVFWYYWGDSISPSCIENGCDGRSREQWTAMTKTLAQQVRDEMGGSEVLIVLENEFNKGGITDPSYAPKFDAYLEDVALELKKVNGVKLVVGFGAWTESHWERFPKTIAQSEYIGFQMMRGSTRDSTTEYDRASTRILELSNFVSQKFNKPSFLYDLALSSYPDASWEARQAKELQEVFDVLSTAGNVGLKGVLYRSLKDNPNMGLHNYFGYAERHWGLWYAYDGGPKPAWDVWLKMAGSAQPSSTPEQAPAPAPAPAALVVPGAVEGESMTYKANGQAYNDGAASGGKAWLLWANGEMRQTLESESTKTLRLSVTARADLMAGVGARMEVRLDGATVGVQQIDVTKWTTYDFDINVPAGASTLALAFTNDAKTATEDRNLRVDRVTLALPPAPAPNHAPIAVASAEGAWLSWSFSANGSKDDDGDALTYAWTFSDGASAEGPVTTREFAEPGEYVARLVVGDGKDASETSVMVKAERQNRAPEAAFVLSRADLTFRFDAGPSTDADGDNLTYAWDFGDGVNATGREATHAYAAGGDYIVSLTVSDGKANATATQQVTATRPNTAPVASFTVSGSDLSYAFDASDSADAEGDALAYTWNFGDGTFVSGKTARHEFAAGGRYAVTLTVDDGRATSNASREIVATPPNRAPVAAFTAVGANLSYAFDASASSDADGDGLTYAWTFGDGTNATGRETRRDYAKAGTYTVTLTVSDGKATHSANRTVEAKAPSAPPAPAPAGNLRLELEDAASKDNGMRVRDASASSGAYWFLWGNGGAHQATDLAPGKYAFDLVARGDFADGWPTVELRADGQTVATWTVSSATWTTYRATVDLPAGAKSVSVVFVNDYYANGKDRNVRVDALRAEPAAEAPRPTMRFEGESMRGDNGMAVSHAGASGSRVWLLWSDGGLHQEVTLPAGKWRVDVIATGDDGKGWPAMDIRVDGRTLTSATVDPTRLGTYSANTTFATEGKHTVSLVFTNDARGPNWDRNLRIDAVTLTPIA